MVALLKDKASLTTLIKRKDGLFLLYKDVVLHITIFIRDAVGIVGNEGGLKAGAHAVEKFNATAATATCSVAGGAANCMQEDSVMLRLK